MSVQGRDGSRAARSSIIFLHGASSSGKSTLAQALREALSLPFWTISIDHLRDAGVLPTARIARGDFDWRAMRQPFFDGFHRSLAAYAEAGNNLIVEHIIDTPGWIQDLALLLAPHDVFFVALHCPLDHLERREFARGDRRLGDAARDYHSIHRGMIYDLELQSLDGVAPNVDCLIKAWNERHGPSAFERMRGQCGGTATAEAGVCQQG